MRPPNPQESQLLDRQFAAFLKGKISEVLQGQSNRGTGWIAYRLAEEIEKVPDETLGLPPESAEPDRYAAAQWSQWKAITRQLLREMRERGELRYVRWGLYFRYSGKPGNV